ncbi:NADH-quinone oxidoreductase subunit L [Myxococcota bacterium]|nr:NADH-quinone oxidoreductase subunit L [Myxococcota bacterium]
MELQTFNTLWLIPLFPLLGAAYAGLLGKRIHRRYGELAVSLPTVIMPWISFAVAVSAVVTLAQAGPEVALYNRLWTWIGVDWMQADMAFLVDRLSAVMILVVTFVGSLIHVYSLGYMKGDPGYWRFFAYLNLFMFSMLVLVLGDNFLLMFVGWEGVGLCSYLLISYYYRERDKAAAGMKAFIVNRVGDFGFTLGVFLLFWGLAAANSPSYNPSIQATTAAPVVKRASAKPDPAKLAEHVAFQASWGLAGAPCRSHQALGRASTLGGHAQGHHVEGHATTSLAFRHVERLLEDPVKREGLLSQNVLGLSLVTLVGLLLFLGATGKSAQIPLYVWLPDAMAGPTPVSALIHAATMVTAGVYMLSRLHFLMALTPVAMTVVATVGALTAFFAATIGLFQYDIKKVLAYSTVSQLGFMFVAVGSGAFWVAIFHLMTHAFFKACLFLGSGSVIMGCHHEQDMRLMGGLRKLMPVTAITYFISSAAIAGFPLFSGFFSKDEILWKAFDTGNVILPGGGFVLWLLAAVAALMTSFYMFRSYYMTFSGEYRGGHAHEAHGHDEAHGAHGHLPRESPKTMTIVLGILAALALAGGYVGLPHLWHLPNLFEHWLAPVFEGSAHTLKWAGYGHGLEWGLMITSILIAFAGFFAARWLYRDHRNPTPQKILDSDRRLVRGVHRWVFNKYYVDELYQKTVIQPTLVLSRALSIFDTGFIDAIVNLVGLIGRLFSMLQGWIDRTFIDGLVNLVGDTVMNAGRALRRVQTGRLQAYVYSLVAGSLLMVVAAWLMAA